ncbi:hypothetical protein M885DRAFT_575240 [Pelagophyceae sp. CCMP2097]|nr:hypothetical protein M885DRAFT_575240 [Pelagophyceae sp. CCMP2097]
MFQQAQRTYIELCLGVGVGLCSGLGRGVGVGVGHGRGSRGLGRGALVLTLPLTKALEFIFDEYLIAPLPPQIATVRDWLCARSGSGGAGPAPDADGADGGADADGDVVDAADLQLTIVGEAAAGSLASDTPIDVHMDDDDAPIDVHMDDDVGFDGDAGDVEVAAPGSPHPMASLLGSLPALLAGGADGEPAAAAKSPSSLRGNLSRSMTIKSVRAPGISDEVRALESALDALVLPTRRAVEAQLAELAACLALVEAKKGRRYSRAAWALRRISAQRRVEWGMVEGVGMADPGLVRRRLRVDLVAARDTLKALEEAPDRGSIVGGVGAQQRRRDLVLNMLRLSRLDQRHRDMHLWIVDALECDMEAPEAAPRLATYAAAWLVFYGSIVGCIYYLVLWASIWGKAKAGLWLVNCAVVLVLYYAIVKSFAVLFLGALLPRIARIPLARYDDVERLFAPMFPHVAQTPGPLALLEALARGSDAGVRTAVRRVEAVAASSALGGVGELLAQRDAEALAAFLEHNLDDVHAAEVSQKSRLLDAALFLLFALVLMPGEIQDLILEEMFAFVPLLAQGILPANALDGRAGLAVILGLSGVIIALVGIIIDAMLHHSPVAVAQKALSYLSTRQKRAPSLPPANAPESPALDGQS